MHVPDLVLINSWRSLIYYGNSRQHAKDELAFVSEYFVVLLFLKPQSHILFCLKMCVSHRKTFNGRGFVVLYLRSLMEVKNKV